MAIFLAEDYPPPVLRFRLTACYHHQLSKHLHLSVVWFLKILAHPVALLSLQVLQASLHAAERRDYRCAFYPCKAFLNFSLAISFAGTNYNPATIPPPYRYKQIKPNEPLSFITTPAFYRGGRAPLSRLNLKLTPFHGHPIGSCIRSLK